MSAREGDPSPSDHDSNTRDLFAGRRFRKWWLSVTFHWALLLAVLGFVILVYFLTHKWLDEKYRSHSNPILEASAKRLQFRIEPESRRLRLTIDDRNVELGRLDIDGGFLGIEKLPSFRGLLAEGVRATEDINERVEGEARRLLVGSPTVQTAEDKWALRLSEALGSAPPEDFAGAFFEYPRKHLEENLRRLQSGKVEPRDFERVYGVISGDTLQKRAIEPTLFCDELELRTSDGSWAADAALRVKLEVDSKRIALQPSGGRARSAKLSQGVRDDLRRAFLEPFVVSYERFLHRCAEVPGAATRESAPVPKPRPAVEVIEEVHLAPTAIAAEWSCYLQATLVSLLRAELGELWFFSRFKWCEVAYWTVFGVLIHALYNLGIATLRLRMETGERWEPRETLRVIGRMAYAPFLTVAFLWLAISTNLIEGTSFLATSTFGVLAFAFLVGFMPNHLLRLMVNVLQTILRGGKGDSKDEKEPPQKEIVPGTRPVPPTEPPSIDKLKATLENIATAPLK